VRRPDRRRHQAIAAADRQNQQRGGGTAPPDPARDLVSRPVSSGFSQTAASDPIRDAGGDSTQALGAMTSAGCRGRGAERHPDCRFLAVAG